MRRIILNIFHTPIIVEDIYEVECIINENPSFPYSAAFIITILCLFIYLDIN